MLSNTCKYAIRAVIYLVVNKNEGKVGIKKISSDLDIPSPFLGKILQSLVKHRILNSTKGPNGGFGIGKDPEDIVLMDIVEIIDGVDNFEKCAIGVKYCSEQENQCAVHKQYSILREEMKSIFNYSKISELAKEIQNNKTSLFI